ncbi:MAG: hypothetical protein PVH78_03320 [Deltaproteobacteria bacterium]
MSAKSENMVLVDERFTGWGEEAAIAQSSFLVFIVSAHGTSP